MSQINTASQLEQQTPTMLFRNELAARWLRIEPLRMCIDPDLTCGIIRIVVRSKRLTAELK